MVDRLNLHKPLRMIILTAAALAVHGNDTDTLRARLSTAYVASAGTSRSAEHLASQLPDGSWADIDYANTDKGTWPVVVHLDRVKDMAAAFLTPGNSMEGSAELRSGVANGLGFWYARKPASSNWWWNDIGQQQRLGKILVMMKGVLADSLILTGAGYLNDPGMSGQNLIWLATETVQRGCVTGSAADITLGMDAISGEVKTTTSDGIQPDFSFHQHGEMLYNAGYGLDYIVDAAQWAYMVRGLSFAFPQDKIDILAGLLLEGDRWMVRGAAMDFSADGREISRTGQSSQAQRLVPACEQLALADPAREGKYQALKDHILSGQGAPVTGNRYFPRSDFTAHHRAGFYLSVKTLSDRTLGSESINGENLKGQWLSFGVTGIYRRGDEYSDIFPVWNWAHLPGVTCPQTSGSPGTKSRHAATFVGGVSDGALGGAVMELNIESTTGRKAWFFLDRELVALGAGIVSTHAMPVHTTVNQCLSKGDVYVDDTPIVSDRYGAAGPVSVFHDSVGYLISAGEAVEVRTTNQSGDWYSINRNYAQDQITRKVFSVWIDHGVGPSNASYAYVVVPAIGRSDFAQYCRTAPVKILANTTAVQAVRDSSAGISGIAFHESGTVALDQHSSVQVDRPCLVLLRETDSLTSVTVSNPLYTAVTVNVAVTVGGRSLPELAFELPDGADAGSSITMSVDRNMTIVSATLPNRSRPETKSVSHPRRVHMGALPRDGESYDLRGRLGDPHGARKVTIPRRR